MTSHTPAELITAIQIETARINREWAVKERTALELDLYLTDYLKVARYLAANPEAVKVEHDPVLDKVFLVFTHETDTTELQRHIERDAARRGL